MGIKIITDSTADLPKSILEKYNITMVPLTVTFGEEEYQDNIDLTSEEFYKRLAKAQELPRTSQVPPDKFIRVFEEETKKNDSLIVILLSSKASGTYQSAVIASLEFPDKDITVVDSLQMSSGTGILALEAAKMAQQGKNKEEILNKMEKMKEKIRLWFAVDDLKALQRGGRISGAQAFIGGMLNLKPLLTAEDGLIKPVDKVRGRKKVYSKIIEWMKEEIENHPDTIVVAHAVQIEAAEELKEIIQKEFSPKEIIITEIGSVIGTHAGPGVIGVFYLKK